MLGYGNPVKWQDLVAYIIPRRCLASTWRYFLRRIQMDVCHIEMIEGEDLH
jgi:hypothetical protein